MTYAVYSQKISSEKITICTMDAVEQLKIFTLDSGTTYVKNVNHFIIGVKNAGTALSAGTLPLSTNEYYFNPITLQLYVNLATDPKENDLSVTYRFFFANAPFKYAYDLSSGVVVDWDSRLDSVGGIGQQLDEENTGIVLESQSSVTFDNNDGFFDEIFDTLIWENQEVKFYSTITGSGEFKKLFDGVVESKQFAPDKVSIKVKDFVHKLQDLVSLELFTDSDGELSPSIIGTPKRRIYGQVNQVRTIAIDATLDGYPLTGTFTGLITTDQITGTGTFFLKELSPGDEIIFLVEGEETKATIQSITSDTVAILSSALDVDAIGITGATVKPEIPYRFKNRRWHLAGHKLRAPIATITDVIANNRYEVDSTEDFIAGIQCDVNGDLSTIRRISGNEIVFQNAITPLPVVSDEIKRLPVNNVFFGPTELIYQRDWDVVNTTEAIIEFDVLAEFNATKQKKLPTSFTWTNASRTVTTSAVVDLRAILKPRDWIRKDKVTEPEWYEILSVSEQTVLLRTAFTGATESDTAIFKNVTYIDDDSLILANCLGMESGGAWIKRPANAVRHLVLNDAGFSAVNETKFTEAANDCDYILSMVIPATIGAKPPKVKDVITQINESVFGSLYGDSSFDISYSILNAEKPEDTELLEDSDILSFSTSSTQKIVNKVIVNYSPFVDRFNGEDALEIVEFNSGFVDRLIGINNTLEKTVYLYEQDKVEIIAQRLALFHSMSSTVVKVKAKLNLALKAVNDKMFLSLDRLYKRYGGKDKKKIGTIISIKKDGFNTDVDFVDLSNVYNRVPAIAPNTTADYSANIPNDFVRWGYIVDDDTLTPDNTSEDQLGNNIIG
jgi:hypothetical protein